MAFCDNCGKWVKEGARFCLHCGMDQLPRRADFSAANPMPQSIPAKTIQPEPVADTEAAMHEAAVAKTIAPAPGVFARVRESLRRQQPAPAPLPGKEIPAPLAEEAYAIMDMEEQALPEETLQQLPPSARTPGMPVYLVQLLLMLLPFVGLLIAFIWAFTDERNIQRRDLARAVLIAYLIIALVLSVMLLVLGPMVRAQLFDPLQGGDPLVPENDGSFDEFFDQFNSTPRGSSRV